eukprot:CAMPEP_0204619138 /NCGR_PEP_ID=MMETSP0717-20131115/5595_1 /ASSEMBLY_ACC=CAM_ASM_000666 /TAXON_ID=230516 /ORGANISM="Chaetoceros curvisetus" /LENGTH=58 /DNA_ID=CAMNT_0051633055 /DNA_START=96 /DNA_END=269 /DNA_ORIENTATION=-
MKAPFITFYLEAIDGTHVIAVVSGFVSKTYIGFMIARWLELSSLAYKTYLQAFKSTDI